MFRRYLSIGNIPEMRADPIQVDKVGNELEVLMPIDVYWEIEEIIKEIRYARIQGNSGQRLWTRFSKLVYPYIVNEKDRLWFRRNVRNRPVT